VRRAQRGCWLVKPGVDGDANDLYLDGHTLFPHLDVITTAGYLTLAMVVLAAVGTVLVRVSARPCHPPEGPDHTTPAPVLADRTVWRMPSLTLLRPVTWSTGTRLGMLALRGYLVVGAVLLVVKAVQLGRG